MEKKTSRTESKDEFYNAVCDTVNLINDLRTGRRSIYLITEEEDEAVEFLDHWIGHA